MSRKFLLFGFIIFVLLNSSCSLNLFRRDGIYLIPKGYTGDVIIFFNQPDGVTPEVENGLYVYKIPDDGVLKVKPAGVTGRVDEYYFYVDKNNDRQKINYLRITGETKPNGEPQNKFGDITQNDYENTVYVMNTGGIAILNTKNGEVQYTSFIVGTPKEGDNLYAKMQERITDLIRKIIQNSQNN